MSEKAQEIIRTASAHRSHEQPGAAGFQGTYVVPGIDYSSSCCLVLLRCCRSLTLGRRLVTRFSRFSALYPEPQKGCTLGPKRVNLLKLQSPITFSIVVLTTGMCRRCTSIMPAHTCAILRAPFTERKQGKGSIVKRRIKVDQQRTDRSHLSEHHFSTHLVSTGPEPRIHLAPLVIRIRKYTGGRERNASIRE